MPIQYPEVLSLKEEGRRFQYTDEDTILYALGIGLGADPLKRNELPFVYEKAQKAVPTLATVVAWEAGVKTDQLGANYRLILHGEEETILHRPMPASGDIIADSSVIDIFD